jgi:hypothetical protein
MPSHSFITDVQSISFLIDGLTTKFSSYISDASGNNSFNKLFSLRVQILLFLDL